MISRGLEIADDEIELHHRVKKDNLKQDLSHRKVSLSRKESEKNKLKEAAQRR